MLFYIQMQNIMTPPTCILNSGNSLPGREQQNLIFNAATKSGRMRGGL